MLFKRCLRKGDGEHILTKYGYIMHVNGVSREHTPKRQAYNTDLPMIERDVHRIGECTGGHNQREYNKQNTLAYYVSY